MLCWLHPGVQLVKGSAVVKGVIAAADWGRLGSSRYAPFLEVLLQLKRVLIWNLQWQCRHLVFIIRRRDISDPKKNKPKGEKNDPDKLSAQDQSLWRELRNLVWVDWSRAQEPGKFESNAVSLIFCCGNAPAGVITCNSRCFERGLKHQDGDDSSNWKLQF